MVIKSSKQGSLSGSMQNLAEFDEKADIEKAASLAPVKAQQLLKEFQNPEWKKVKNKECQAWTIKDEVHKF
jgi:hypothetical protein